MNIPRPNALIIEDNKLLKWSLVETIEGEGLEVYAVDNCSVAFEMAESIDFHLIFAEVGMEKIKTLEILNQIQAIQTNSRFVLMTSLVHNEIKNQSGDLRISAILEKPFDLSQIQAVVREYSDIT